jgi:predicted ATP-grasp superfamily ATP-dependent carboligase
MSVLITHAHHRLAYYAVRCLAKHGIDVVCGSEFPLAGCFFSRYCSGHFTYPSPWEHPDHFVDRVIEEIKRREIGVLMPVHREGYVLSRYKDTLDHHTSFLYPSFSDIIAVNDKANLVKTAKEASINIPRTIIPEGLDCLEKIKSELRFPVIIKPRRGHGGIGQIIVEEPSRIETTYLKTLNNYGITVKEEYPIVQELIMGKKLYVGMLFNHGELRASFGHHAIRRYSAATYAVQCEDPRGNEQLRRLAEYLKWHGIISADLFLEEGTQIPYLTDINPRFWGSIYLAIWSGVEFPYLLYRMAIDGDISPVTEYTKNLEGRWLLGEVAYLIEDIMKASGKHVQDTLICRAPVSCWDPKDPIPFYLFPLPPLTRLIRHRTIQPPAENYC